MLLDCDSGKSKISMLPATSPWILRLIYWEQLSVIMSCSEVGTTGLQEVATAPQMWGDTGDNLQEKKKPSRLEG